PSIGRRNPGKRGRAEGTHRDLRDFFASPAGTMRDCVPSLCNEDDQCKRRKENEDGSAGAHANSVQEETRKTAPGLQEAVGTSTAGGGVAVDFQVLTGFALHRGPVGEGGARPIARGRVVGNGARNRSYNGDDKLGPE